MRYLLICVLLILGCLALFIRQSQSERVDGLQAAVRPPVEPHVERGAPGLAGVSARNGSEARHLGSQGQQAAGVERAAGDEMNFIPSRILVHVLGRDGELDPSLFEGLRVQAQSLRSRGEFGAPAAVSSKGPGLEGTIEVPVGGRYRVLVDPDSVPDGYLGSGVPSLGPLDSSGIAAAFVDVPDGGEVQATLRVFRVSTLSGWVTSGDGTGLAGVTVRAQGIAPGMAGLSHDVVTEEDGTFEFGGLFPVIYGVQMIDAGVHGEALSGVPRPPRQLFDLRYGPYSGVELRARAGPVTVSGRVVDDLGEPFADVSVRAFYVGDEAHGVALEFERTFTWSDHALLVRTGRDGRFQIPGLRGVPIRVQVGAEEAANGAARRARFVPPPVEVPLGQRSSGAVDLGDLVLERTRRFVARGQVLLTAGELDGTGLKYGRLRVTAVPYAKETLAPGLPGQETRPLVEFDRRTGEVTVSCETTRPSCAFTVELRGHAATRKVFTLLPAGGGPVRAEFVDQVWMFP